MPPTEAEIKQFLGKEKFAPSILSSKKIVNFAIKNGAFTKAGYVHELVGEALFRNALYNSNVPHELKTIVEHEEVNQYKSNPTVVAYIKSRENHFRDADGIIALLDTHSKEALPIAFKTSVRLTAAGVFDSSTGIIGSIKVPSWSKDLSMLAKGAKASYNYVQLLVPLGPFAEMLDGKSHMLALAISMNPTKIDGSSVIATGSVVGGNIERVSGIKEKQELAKRMGAKFVSLPEKSTHIDFEIKPDESLVVFIKRWKKAFGPSSAEKIIAILKKYWFQIAALILLIAIGVYLITPRTPPPLPNSNSSYLIKCQDKKCNGLMRKIPFLGNPFFGCTNWWSESEKCEVSFSISHNEELLCSKHKGRKFILAEKQDHWTCKHENPCIVEFADRNLAKSIIDEDHTGNIKCPNHVSGCKGFLTKRESKKTGYYYRCSDHKSKGCKLYNFPLRCPKETKNTSIKLLELRDVNGSEKWVCPDFPKCEYFL